ncbi:MBL fold metallo-hydrolase [Thermomonas flagellata]|uniref:MBL fold metallo-hydrolase n=1 Tax=Thermomonas flagellata TaxID=2888524 RepID=UPI001F035AAF|nr:MBL fold metallo-hydrolase [Thermomonas flagellata]
MEHLRKHLKLLALLLLAGLLFWVAVYTAYAGDWARSSVPMQVQQVGPHTYYVQGVLDEATRQNQGFIANAGFVVTGDGVVVFDTLGSPALGEQLIAQIRKRTREPIKLVILSHFHADHFYGIPAFKAVGAQVWANSGIREYLHSDAARERLAERKALIGPWLGKAFTLPTVDVWLDSDVDFQMGQLHFRLRHVGPAHTPEDTALLVVEDGVLYSGDVVYAGRVPFIGDADTRSWLKAIDKVLALQPKVMVPGHGPVSRDPVRDATLTRDYITFLRTQMGQAARDFVPFDEAYAKVDWSKFAAEPTFDVANRNNAYNVYLQMEQELLGK